MLNKQILNELITTVQSFYFINFWNNFKVEFSKFILMKNPTSTFIITPANRYAKMEGGKFEN